MLEFKKRLTEDKLRYCLLSQNLPDLEGLKAAGIQTSRCNPERNRAQCYLRKETVDALMKCLKDIQDPVRLSRTMWRRLTKPVYFDFFSSSFSVCTVQVDDKITVIGTD